MAGLRDAIRNVWAANLPHREQMVVGCQCLCRVCLARRYPGLAFLL